MPKFTMKPRFSFNQNQLDSTMRNALQGKPVEIKCKKCGSPINTKISANTTAVTCPNCKSTFAVEFNF